MHLSFYVKLSFLNLGKYLKLNTVKQRKMSMLN